MEAEPQPLLVLSSGRTKQAMMPSPPLPPPSTGRPREVPSARMEDDAMSARTVSSRDHRSNPTVSRRPLATQSILHQPETSWRFLHITGDFATKDVLTSPLSIKGRRDEPIQPLQQGSSADAIASTGHAVATTSSLSGAASTSDGVAVPPVAFDGGAIADAEQVLASMLSPLAMSSSVASIPPRPLLFAGTNRTVVDRKAVGQSPSTFGVHVDSSSRMQVSSRLAAHSSLSVAPSERGNVPSTGLRRDRAKRPIDATLAASKAKVVAPQYRDDRPHADAVESLPLAVRRAPERAYTGVGNSPKGRMLREHATTSAADHADPSLTDPSNKKTNLSTLPLLDALLDEMQCPTPISRPHKGTASHHHVPDAANNAWHRQHHDAVTEQRSGTASLNGTRLLVHNPPLEGPLRDISDQQPDDGGVGLTPVSSLAKYRDQLAVSRAEGHFSASQQVLALEPRRLAEHADANTCSNDAPGVGFAPMTPCSTGARRPTHNIGATLTRKVSRGVLRQGQSKAMEDAALRIHHMLYTLLEQETQSCTHDLLTSVPFLEEEALPVEEDLTSRMDIQRLYLTLHPLDRVEVASSVPPALQHAVAKTLKGVVVPLSLGVTGETVGEGIARSYVATKTIDSVRHRMWHEAPGHVDISKLVGSKDYEDRCRLMHILRIKQREAETFLGVATTYTKIPPPLLPDELLQGQDSLTVEKTQRVEVGFRRASGQQQAPLHAKGKSFGGGGAITSLSDIRLEHLEEVADASDGRVLEMFHALEKVARGRRHARAAVGATCGAGGGASDDDAPL